MTEPDAAEHGALLAAFAANTAPYYREYGALPGGAAREEPDRSWFRGGVPEPWFNGVVQGYGAPPPTAATIARLADDFAGRRLPFLWHCPAGIAAAATAPLLAHGLRPFAAEPVLALDLPRMTFTPEPLAGLTIDAVADEAALRAWTAVWLSEAPEPTRRRCRDAYQALGLGFGECYLGSLAGVPVATVKLFYAAGVVSVQHVATSPAARRRGIARALVGHALGRARARGYRHALLTSTPAGLPLYTGLGFVTVGRSASFLWRPPAAGTDR